MKTTASWKKIKQEELAKKKQKKKRSHAPQQRKVLGQTRDQLLLFCQILMLL